MTCRSSIFSVCLSSALVVAGFAVTTEVARADRLIYEYGAPYYDERGRPGRGHPGRGPRHGAPPHAGPRDRAVVVVPRQRRYRDIVVRRPYGHSYSGYGHYHKDNDAYKWLAFTAIAVKVLDNLNEAQQRRHESAQVRATTAPLGQAITWNEGGASGSVTTTRIGTSPAGLPCREFQQNVTVGGRTEQAYGTACLQPDGAWKVVR